MLCAPIVRRLRVRFSLALALVVCTGAGLAPTPFALQAQERGAAQRVLQGKVQDKSGAGLKGAVVYLKDDHTSAVKTAIADDDGSYRFGQLAQGTDYEVWATLGDKKSSTKTISSFDTKNAFTINLKIG